MTVATHLDDRAQVIAAPDTIVWKNSFVAFVTKDIEIVGDNDTRTRWFEDGKSNRLPEAVFLSQAPRYADQDEAAAAAVAILEDLTGVRKAL